MDHSTGHPPTWLASLADRLCAQLTPVDVLAPLGCHYHFHEDAKQWEITLFAARTEIVGGKCDGHVEPSKFQLDLLGTLNLFEDVSHFRWQAFPFGTEDALGAHVALEGRFEGHFVWVRILAQAPERYDPGRIIDANSLSIKDLW